LECAGFDGALVKLSFELHSDGLPPSDQKAVAAMTTPSAAAALGTPVALAGHFRGRVLALIFILALSFSVRTLTANFMRAHLSDAGWFQWGSFAVFDRQAQNVLDGKESFFWIPDSSRTDLMQYPPGFRLWLATIYGLTGNRSAVSILLVHTALDALAVLLVVGIGAVAYGWRVGLVAGVLAALSPLLALNGITPMADAPTSWLVLGGVLFLVIAAKKRSIYFALAAGAFLGLASWMRVNPLLLFVPWAIALFLIVPAIRRQRLAIGLGVALATLLVISPVVMRNLVVFYPEVAPTGLNVGWNLLAGIGETERGAEFGAPCCDEKMIEQDRVAMNLPPDVPLALTYPDGIRRDRERGRRALAIIKSHPVWFAGVMARRTWGHLKFAGKPAPNVGSAGINVTAPKTLPENRQTGVLAFSVNTLGAIQSIWRWLALPLMLLGICFAFQQNRGATWLLLSTVAYYLATLAIGHSEIRYGLPMQAILIIFAGVTVSLLPVWSRRVWIRVRPNDDPARLSARSFQ
jgi:dolichyl-phosphate-mannose-protein mannosyltransferase